MVKKFPAFYRTQSSLSYSQKTITSTCPKLGKSTPLPHMLFKIHFRITISSMLRSPKWPLLFWFANWNTVWIFNFSHACYVPCQFHSPWFAHLAIYGEEYKLWSFSLCNFLHPPVTSSILGLNILLCTLFSDTLNPCSSQCDRPNLTSTQENW